MNVLERVGEIGVVPVVVIDDAVGADALGDALVAGGLRCAEITFRTPAAEQALATLAGRGDLLVGAGTVIDVAQADRAIDAGARFVVTPGLDAEIVRHCIERGVSVLPGIATATEVLAALREGLETVKLFPAGALGGLAMVRALAAPFPSLRFVPTGGIGADDVAGYLAHPAVLAVGGSWLVARNLVEAGRFDEIAALAAQAASTVAGVRASSGVGA
jgi:2-dehydro-3-deoxyphosphogluconate aldolase / (4S)-4-hydroxy-2-oxoglutarate aldolase